MSDWEEVDVPLPVKTSWSDEDADEDVKDNWDDSEDEKPKVVVPLPKKKTVEEKQKERQEMEAKKLEEKLEKERLANESPAERKQREEQMQRDADLQNAADLFAGVSLDRPTSTREKKLPQSLDAFEPNTKSDFDTLIKLIAQKTGNFSELLVPMKAEDVRKISSTVTAHMNEKIKAEKEKSKKKTTKRAQLNVRASSFNDEENDNFDDFDGFM